MAASIFANYAPGIYNMNETHYWEHVAHMARFDKTWDRCAVVGTSSVLLKVPLGKYIDGFDAIFRVNDAPIDDAFVRFTGARDHIRVGTHPMSSKSKHTIYYCHIRWYPTQCWSKTAVDHHPRVSPSFVRTVKRSHNLQKWPTSGLIAYEIANRLCNSIKVFGFGIDPSFSNCSHYYNTYAVRNCVYRYGPRLRNSMRYYNKYAKTVWHDMEKEWAFFKDKAALTAIGSLSS